MTGTDETVLKIERKHALLELTLNRPGSANALNPELTEAVIEAITQARDIRLCVIRGAGRHFCAGFDLAGLEDSSDGDLLWRLLRIETLLQAVHHAPFAVLALGQGQIVGAGADLFTACWRRAAAADARFRMPGWNFELAPRHAAPGTPDRAGCGARSADRQPVHFSRTGPGLGPGNRYLQQAAMARAGRQAVATRQCPATRRAGRDAGADGQ